MPIVAHTTLPTFENLRQRGQQVLQLNDALQQDIRELHIGLLNMMPDAALRVTEQQYMRLIGNSNQIAQFYVHPFSLPALQRAPDTQAYVDDYYRTFEEIRAEGLDALIITGANVTSPYLDREPFWEPLREVLDWANQNVTSILCSCLASHALLKHIYGIERRKLPMKQWGVFGHRIMRPDHPLLWDINTRFDVPHSRWNEITREQLEDANLSVLVESRQAGVQVAVSRDQFRFIFFQGHPEYDVNSLLKEYKREVLRYLNGELEQSPPHPENYFSVAAAAIAERYLGRAELAMERGESPPPFPEERILPLLDNTWGDTAKSIINNWLGLVYRLTDHDRKKQFMPGVDPDDPLGLLRDAVNN